MRPAVLLLLLAVLALVPAAAHGQTNPESDYIIEKPYPLGVVVIRGSQEASGAVRVTKIKVQAVRRSVIRVQCLGKRCPKKSLTRTVGRRTSVRIGAFERVLRPGATLVLRIARPGQLGKYVSFKVRAKKPPVRKDACVRPGGRKPVSCF